MAWNVNMSMNPWEVQALEYQFPDEEGLQPTQGETSGVPRSPWQAVPDSVFYPGLYSATGFDLMAILVRLMSRPNPQVDIGPVDCSVALVLCDLERPDHPIVYASDAFCELTGYAQAEILGRNCRFLQKPHPDLKGKSKSKPKHDKTAASRMRQALQTGNEIQLKVVNYRKDGRRFNNFVSIIPVSLDESGYLYGVGLLGEVE